jgi:hypothetical protein
MLLDGYLRHSDVVERHQTVVNASREATCRVARESDFVRALMPVARFVLEQRDVPRAIRALAHRAEQLPPDTAFTLADATARAFVLLGERRGRAVAIGAVGKLWKPVVTFLPLDATEFREFQQPKYVKLAIAFWVEAFGHNTSVLRFEARGAATDDSARTHFLRWYRVVQPYTALFMRRVLANMKAEAEAIAAPALLAR